MMRILRAGNGQLGNVDRREWLRVTTASAIGFGAHLGRPWANAGLTQADEHPSAEAALNEIRRRLVQAKIGPLSTVRSARYVAVGDAAQGFMKLILGDCEQLARDYLDHFRRRGFEVAAPESPLTLVVFQDDRSYRRFLHEPADIRPPAVTGFYQRKTNVLHVFDWRNVPMAPRSSVKNIHTLSHEGTHQLTFSTGILRRDGDVPLCIIEGLGTYGEARQTSGHSDLGRLNLDRMANLAGIQRRVPRVPYIFLRELFAVNSLQQIGDPYRIALFYAESWLLVHYLMQEQEVLPRFRRYLKAIYPRSNADHRLDDAQTHLGDLDKLDAELRRYAVRLQMSAP